MALYFITEAVFNPFAVKIGYSNSPLRRLSEISVGNHRLLKIDFVTHGDAEEEKRVHEIFSHLRIRGEWYLYTDEIKQYIQKNRLPLNDELSLLGLKKR